MNAPLLFDPSTLAMLLELEDGNDPSEVQSIVEQFREDAAGIFSKLATAIATNDLAATAAQAHSLKGGTSQLGMLQLAEIAGQIEVNARNEHTETLVSLLDSAQASYRVSMTALDAFLAAPRG